MQTNHSLDTQTNTKNTHWMSSNLYFKINFFHRILIRSKPNIQESHLLSADDEETGDAPITMFKSKKTLREVTEMQKL